MPTVILRSLKPIKSPFVLKRSFLDGNLFTVEGGDCLLLNLRVRCKHLRPGINVTLIGSEGCQISFVLEREDMM